MPSGITHLVIAENLGYPNSEVDEWMDVYWKTKSSSHRNYRHTPKELVDEYGISPQLITGLIHIGADTEPKFKDIPSNVLKTLEEMSNTIPEARELYNEFYNATLHREDCIEQLDSIVQEQVQMHSQGPILIRKRRQRQKQKQTRINVSDEEYWKLLELSAKLRCETWNELVNKLYNMAIGNEQANRLYRAATESE